MEKHTRGDDPGRGKNRIKSRFVCSLGFFLLTRTSYESSLAGWWNTGLPVCSVSVHRSGLPWKEGRKEGTDATPNSGRRKGGARKKEQDATEVLLARLSFRKKKRA